MCFLSNRQIIVDNIIKSTSAVQVPWTVDDVTGYMHRLVNRKRQRQSDSIKYLQKKMPTLLIKNVINVYCNMWE